MLLEERAVIADGSTSKEKEDEARGRGLAMSGQTGKGKTAHRTWRICENWEQDVVSSPTRNNKAAERKEKLESQRKMRGGNWNFSKLCEEPGNFSHWTLL